MAHALPEEPLWPLATPNGGARRVVFLLDASSRLERRLLLGWIARNAPAVDTPASFDVLEIPPTRRRPRRPRLDPRFETCVAAPDDPLLAPLRVVWQPEEVGGVRAARLRDLVTFGDPRDPGWLRERWVLRRHPDRCRIVAGEPAPLSELRERWRRAAGTDLAQTTGLAEFVARQAALALERAERRLRGARYKVPRFVHEDILGGAAFRARLGTLARELQRPEAQVAREAARDLREIAATHSPYVIDLVARLIRRLYTLGYGETLHYERTQLNQVAALAQRHPVVFLPSHKSNLDHLVLQYALHENGLPPNHTAGGINMNFFPVGPLVRRSGVFFIRRTFKDDPVYKTVLHHYIGYLIEKRFPLEWYVEGGRSRSGKLLPPRFGLLSYVVDAYRAGKSEDVFLIPVSIAYDQIQDVGDYVAEQRGGKKKTESFSWFVRVLRQLRRRYGEIYIRFGDPLSLAKTLGAPDLSAPDKAAAGSDEESLAVQKLAFEVSVRINRATPITPTSLVTLALLGSGDRALSAEEAVEALRRLVAYVRRRALPTTCELELDTKEGVQRALAVLVESGVVVCFSEGPEAVYAIGPDQHLTAAYYRNTVIHFFVNGSIAELALLRAAEEGVVDRTAEFWDEAMRLRDLLKFEFFFAEKEKFRGELRQELALHDGEWESRLSRGSAEILALVERIHPFSAHRVLRPFLEAYRVVGDALERQDPGTPCDAHVLLGQCLALGKQYRLQRRIQSAESVSRVLFETALRLARNRGLLEPELPDLAARRAAFAREMREAIRRVDGIAALAASRRAGVIG
ncbi:MAG TPA: glycerol-3-phosphate 1-O-acyltransferase [Myxococcota bacterium]|nr:glycerol-3-phosphate 1-O-acyltransferase [Myxococcota bacterium]